MRSAYGHRETPEEVVQLPVPIPGFVDDYAFTIQVGNCGSGIKESQEAGGIIKNLIGEKYADLVLCNQCNQFLSAGSVVCRPNP